MNKKIPPPLKLKKFCFCGDGEGENLKKGMKK